MSAIDGFLKELRAAAAGTPELERLEDCLRVLQTNDSDAAVMDYDRVMRILLHPALSLPERLAAMAETMRTGRL
jgi:hypothetical protein